MCLLALIIQLGTLYQVLPDTAFSKVGQSIAILTIVVAFETVLSVINMGIEDVSYIASKVKNFCCFKTMCCRFNRERREGYEHIPDSPNPPVANSGGDVSLLHQRPNPTNKSVKVV
ncbi:hypothetical protein BSL78_28379 [Apostichopus japonicus]|uniref:Uncharacterized protein n=1 Tax=Stichopus japonicus TaxID=307972 RepID=A0A2G8JGF0_STIJA|nr:hypothetical protein BSL78_28379 [Apostichopus japonicus]